MRVTKTIREFIEKEVSNRLDAKYAAEKEEANFQTKVEQDVWEAAMDAAQKAYDEYMAFGIKDRQSYNGVQCWRRRKDEEARSIVNDIIVEMELGGDKATLMAMLDKVGEV